MAEAPPVTERIAQWICASRYDDLPAVVREKTIDVLYDSVGCMLACSTLREVKAIVEFIEDLGGQHGCTIIGLRATTSVVNAAMAHGGMAHGDEVDPVQLASVGGHVAETTRQAFLRGQCLPRRLSRMDGLCRRRAFR